MSLYRLKPLIPFLVSGVILGIAMDFPQHLGLLSCVAFVPILAHSKLFNTPTKPNFLGMFLFGFIFSLFSTSYFLSTYPLDWLSITNPFVSSAVIGGVWLSFSLAMTLPTMFWLVLVKKAQPHTHLGASLVAASVWVLLEYGRSWFVALSLYGDGTLFGPHHTYYNLGYTFAHIPFINDLLAVGGLYLCSFVIILINCLLYSAHLDKVAARQFSHNTKALAVGLAVLVISCSSLVYLIRAHGDESAVVGVSFITTRFPSGTKYTQEHRAIANTLAPGGVSDLGEIVISPEGFQIDQLFKEPRSGSAQLFIGTTAESSGKTMYYHEYKTRTKYFDDKQILMPIGDYRLVWTDLLLKHTQGESWWNGYVKKFTLATSTGPGHLTDGIYHRDRSPLAILGTICSENISPYIYRDGVVNGATLFLNIASHAPFRGSDLLSRQTLAVNTARAIEGGRSFVTSTNYDSSMVISDKGELLVRTEPTMPIIYTRYNVPIKTYTTPYVRFGDFILIIALAIIVYTAARHKKSQN